DLREWIRKLHKERGITSVFVTHDQDEAMDLANRVVVLHRGRVEQIGTPEAIYDQPATDFVATFIRSTNIVERHQGKGHKEKAFVRPHDIELRGRIDAHPRDDATPAPTSEDTVTAFVERIARRGWLVRVEVRLLDGQPLTVELTKDRLAELAIAEG